MTNLNLVEEARRQGYREGEVGERHRILALLEVLRTDAYPGGVEEAFEYIISEIQRGRLLQFSPNGETRLAQLRDEMMRLVGELKEAVARWSEAMK